MLLRPWRRSRQTKQIKTNRSERVSSKSASTVSKWVFKRERKNLRNLPNYQPNTQACGADKRHSFQKLSGVDGDAFIYATLMSKDTLHSNSASAPYLLLVVRAQTRAHASSLLAVDRFRSCLLRCSSGGGFLSLYAEKIEKPFVGCRFREPIQCGRKRWVFLITSKCCVSVASKELLF